MAGGTGDDTYIVNGYDDVVVENANEGEDQVKSLITYSLTDNVENLFLLSGNTIGYGNSLDNYLAGSTGDNKLYGYAGSDTLYGDSGSDTLYGGSGDDIYLITDSNDTVIEYADQGTDIVESSVAYTLGSNVEYLLLTGTYSYNATGNELDNYLQGNSGDNNIYGNAGNDTLYGNGGDDYLSGGTGDDTYVIDTTTATVFENADNGSDTVQSTISYTLGSNVENLVLLGSSNIDATGNDLSNIIIGNSGNNSLSGQSGDDLYFFSATGGSDVISDSAGTDEILFNSDVSTSDIALFMNGNNLEIAYTGSSLISVTNQSVSTNAIENVVLSDGTFMTSTDINSIIQEMTTYATNNNISMTSISDVQNSQELMTIIANGWHS